MSRSLGLGYKLVVGSFLLCLCRIPSCVLAPVSALLKYMGCVDIYLNVQLAWPGYASCILDLQMLLQTNVCPTVFVKWCLWPGRDKEFFKAGPNCDLLKQHKVQVPISALALLTWNEIGLKTCSADSR